MAFDLSKCSAIASRLKIFTYVIIDQERDDGAGVESSVTSLVCGLCGSNFMLLIISKGIEGEINNIIMYLIQIYVL